MSGLQHESGALIGEIFLKILFSHFLHEFHIKCLTIITNSKKIGIYKKLKTVNALIDHGERRRISATPKVTYLAVYQKSVANMKKNRSREVTLRWLRGWCPRVYYLMPSGMKTKYGNQGWKNKKTLLKNVTLLHRPWTAIRVTAHIYFQVE